MSLPFPISQYFKTESKLPQLSVYEKKNFIYYGKNEKERLETTIFLIF